MKKLITSIVIAGAIATTGVALLADDYERERDSDERESYHEREHDEEGAQPGCGSPDGAVEVRVVKHARRGLLRGRRGPHLVPSRYRS